MDDQVQKDLEDAKQFEEALKALSEKYKMNVSATLDFPLYKQLPDEVQLALKVIERHGGTYRVLYTLHR